LLYILWSEMQEKNLRFFSCISLHSMYNKLYTLQYQYANQ